MNNYVYDLRQESLHETTADYRTMSGFDHISKFVGNLVGTENRAPVDRTTFATTEDEIKDVVSQQGFAIAAPEEQGYGLRLPAKVLRELISIPGKQPDIHNVYAMAQENSRRGAAMRRALNTVQAMAQEEAIANAWWLAYTDKEIYTHNPMESDPTEQFIIGVGTGQPVNVYNFCNPLTANHLYSIARSTELLSQVTNGYSKLLAPNVIVHSAFAAQYFEQDNSWQRPAGQAYEGLPFTELDRDSMDHDAAGSVDQTWTERTQAHELSHHIDYTLNPDKDDFEDYFEYIDHEQDGVIDKVRPRYRRGMRVKTSNRTIDTYCTDTINNSEPIRDYGYSGASEDLAVTSEEVVFGGTADPLRRDAYISVLQDFIHDFGKRFGTNNEAIAYTISQPHFLHIEHRTGSEIVMPAMRQLKEPIKIYVATEIGGLALRRRHSVAAK